MYEQVIKHRRFSTGLLNRLFILHPLVFIKCMKYQCTWLLLQVGQMQTLKVFYRLLWKFLNISSHGLEDHGLALHV